MGDYLYHLVVLAGIYGLLLYSLNLVAGFGGLLSFSHAAFYGIGAYTFAILEVGNNRLVARDLIFSRHLPWGVAFACAVLAGAAAAFVFSQLCARLKGDVFVFASLAVQMLVYSILYNWSGLSRGPFGLTGIPHPEIFGLRADSSSKMALLVVVFDVISIAVLFRLYRSSFGTSLKALRDDELAAESLGVSSLHQRVWALVIAGAYAGAAGALYASYVSFIDPSSFSVGESILMVTMLLLGGSGNRIGPIVGVLIVLLLPEGLRFLGLPDTKAPFIREILIGGSLPVLMLLRPKGLAGEFSLRGR